MANESTQADESVAEESQESDQSNAPQAGNKDASPAGESISLEEARKLRSEAKSLRARMAAAEAKVKAADDAKLSETERLQKRVKELETESERWASERRERDARDYALGVLSDESERNQFRARNPRTVYKLIKDDLQYDDEGKVTNLTELLKQAKADDPLLFGRVGSSVDGGAGSRQNAQAFDMNAQIRRMAGRA